MKLNLLSAGVVSCSLYVAMGVVFAQELGVAKEAGLGLSLTAGAQFTDNRDQIDDSLIMSDGTKLEKEDDTDLTIGLCISYERVIENRYKFYFDYTPSFVYHDNPRDRTEEDSLEHAVNARLEFSPGRRTFFRFTERYWWSGNKNWYFAEDDIYDPTITDVDDINDDYYENRMAAHLQYNFSEKNFMLLDGIWRFRRYDDSELAEDNDEDEYNVRLAIMRSPTRRYSVGFFGDFTSFDRESRNKDYDFGVDYLSLGVQTTIDFFTDESWVLNASTGYNIMEYEDETMDDSNMLGDSRIELAIHQKEKLRGKLGFRYSQDYASVYPYSSEKNTVFYGAVSRILGRNNDYIIGADVEYRMRDYDADDLDPDVLAQREALGLYSGDANRDTIYLRLYLNARLTQSCRATLFYSYEDVDSDASSTKSYDENVFGIRLTYDFL